MKHLYYTYTYYTIPTYRKINQCFVLLVFTLLRPKKRTRTKENSKLSQNIKYILYYIAIV